MHSVPGIVQHSVRPTCDRAHHDELGGEMKDDTDGEHQEDNYDYSTPPTWNKQSPPCIMQYW
jgi:hypothetical protein